MRPRRQTMARGSEAVTSYRGKTKSAEPQKQEKVTNSKSKSQKNSSTANSNGTVEPRSSSRLRTAKSQPEVTSTAATKPRSKSAKTGMTRNPGKKGDGQPKVNLAEPEIMEVDEIANVERSENDGRPTKKKSKKDASPVDEEMKEVDGEDSSKSEKATTSKDNAQSTQGSSESSKNEDDSKTDNKNNSDDKSKENDEPSEDVEMDAAPSTSADNPKTKKQQLKKPATTGRGRKRALPAPPLSVTGQVKRPKVVVERLNKLTRGAGIVLTLGQGDVGQLGLGDEVMERKKPSRVQLSEKIVDICAGGMHTVCLSEDGKVYTFGCNDEGALGRDTSEEGSECVPDVVDFNDKVVQISAGDSHSAILTEDGRVFAWGTFRDSFGSMGLITSSIQKTPQRLLEGIPVAKIASGSDHLAILTVEGHLYTCGCAEQGQLGRVAECFSSRGGRKGLEFLLNPGLASVRRHRGKEMLFDDVWTGSYSTFVRIKDSQDVYVCGLNNYFQLGSSDIRNRYVFEKSESFSNNSWLQIAGGQHHTLALNKKGEVYALGRKEYGRLGLGEEAKDTSQPTLVQGLKDISCIDVACGVATSYAVAESGSVYAWGMGTNFALGTGEEDDQYEPVMITGKQLESQKTIAVSSGGQHAVLLAVAIKQADDGGSETGINQ